MNKHKNLVFVNTTESFAYVELCLESHVIIKGQGNVGKSSILNSFKLFWLPEVNFSGCERKFKFVSRQADSGYYNKDEAFNHYFPTLRSFLILESETMHGDFCQILYPRPNHSYGRIFVKASYSDIEHLFWNKDGGEEGAGEPQTELSINSIRAYLKNSNIEFEDVTTRERLIQLLYTDSVLDKDSQYSLFPLKNQEFQTINTFASLVHAMSGAKSNNGELVNMFANIIEGQKVESNDTLRLDLEKIMVSRDELQKEQAELTHLEVNKHRAKEAISNFDQASGLSNIGSNYLAIKNALDKKRLEHESTQKDLQTKADKKRSEVADLRTDAQNKKSKYDELSGALKTTKKEKEKLEKKLSQGAVIFNEYAKTSITEHDNIYELLTEDTKRIQEELQILLDKEKKAKTIAKLNQEKANLEDELRSVDSQLKNSNSLLVNYVSEHARNVLLSLNPKFVSISMDSFSSDSVTVIENFSSLFLFNNNQTEIDGIKFGTPRPIDDPLTLEGKIEDIKSEIVEINRKLESYSGDDVKLTENAIANHRKDLKKNQDDLSTWKVYITALDEQPEIEANLEACLAEYNAAHTAYLSTYEKLNTAINEGKELKKKIDDIKPALENLKALNDRLKHCSNNPMFGDLINNADSPQEINAAEINETTINVLAKEFGRYASSTNDAKMALQNLVLDGVLEDVNRVSTSGGCSLASLAPLIVSLKHTYEQVEARKQILTDNTNSHKDIIVMKMQELRENATAISSYKDRTNRMFKTLKINNLTGVEVDLILDSRFQSLIEQAEKTDLEGDSGINEAFYDRLSAFITSFFKGGDKELTIDKIIKSVVFKTQKVDEGWDEKGQSNSSVSLIILPLIQRLLKDMLNADVGFKIPMQVDEVSHIDTSQINWVLDMFNENGFTLIGASTTNIGAQTLIAVNSEANIGELKTPIAYTKKRNVVFFGGAEGEIL